MTPFKMVFGFEAIVPIEYTVPFLQLAIKHKLPIDESLKERTQQVFNMKEKV